MVTDAEFDAWLEDSAAARCVLLEANARVLGVETQFFISSRAYFDGVANQLYDDILIGSSVNIVERLSLDGRASLNFGDLELENVEGTRDDWLTYVWTNRSFEILLGDVTWNRADFRTRFIGVAADIDSRNRNVLNLRAVDKLERLNTAVTEDKLGGSTANADELRPLCFGECFNVGPLLVNPATLQYQYHNGPSEQAKEYRSNGVPSNITDTPATGIFVPDINPQGTQVTVSVQGDKPGGTWNTTVSTIIQRLVTGFGEVNNRFTAADLDNANLNAFDAANQQPVGVYMDRRENLLDICNKLADSVGAQLNMSTTGELRLIKIEIPPAGTPHDIEIVDQTLEIKKRFPVVAAHKIRYAKNWRVQDALETGLPESSKDSFSREWSSVTVENATVKANYKLEAEPEAADTFLLKGTDATAEGNRRLAITETPRMIFECETTLMGFNFQLGDPATLTDPRFDLQAGKTGMIIGLLKNLESSTVGVEVLI